MRIRVNLVLHLRAPLKQESIEVADVAGLIRLQQPIAVAEASESMSNLFATPWHSLQIYLLALSTGGAKNGKRDLVIVAPAH